MNVVTKPESAHPPLPVGGEAGGAPERGTFTAGSTLRHVLNMTAAGSIGLVAVFVVDFLTLVYISRLGSTALTAAVGYAAQMVFALISVNIGLSIAVGALVSRALGAGDRAGARRIAASGLALSAMVAGTASLAAWPFAHAIVAALGANGEALAAGTTYLRMILPATAFLGIGMVFASVLRAIGDARRAMYVTLSGAIVTACLDPIFIFVLHLGIDGAAIVTVLSRFCLVLVGWYGAVSIHGLVARPELAAIRRDLRPLAYIAGPAILTNLATPVASMYILHVFSAFGEPIVAAYTIMDRVNPVAFGVLFALSGSVGPIMGQNFGALAFERVRGVLTDCYGVAAAYIVTVSLALWFGAPFVAALFGAKGETAEVLIFFCRWSGALWFFLGGTFVANAAFNNLNAPLLSALFNWCRATLGTAPFATIGAHYYGPKGGYIGLIFGAALFGSVAVFASYRVVRHTQRRFAPAAA